MRYDLRPGAICIVPGMLSPCFEADSPPMVFRPTKLYAAQMYAYDVRKRNARMQVRRTTPVTLNTRGWK